MQIIVYVGAITVLIVFAVMLLEDDLSRARLPKFLRYRIPQRLEGATNLVLHYYGGMQHVLGGVIAAGMMFVIIIVAIAEAAWYQQWRVLQPEPPTQFAGDNVRLIGELFLTTYLVPFEVASVVLLVALVGAVIIARRASPPTPLRSGEGSTADGGDGHVGPGEGKSGLSPTRQSRYGDGAEAPLTNGRAPESAPTDKGGGGEKKGEAP